MALRRLFRRLFSHQKPDNEGPPPKEVHRIEVEYAPPFKTFSTPSVSPDICWYCGGVLEISDSVMRITTHRKERQWCRPCWDIVGYQYQDVLRRATYPRLESSPY
jgi:hypothetical protein